MIKAFFKYYIVLLAIIIASYLILPFHKIVLLIIISSFLIIPTIIVCSNKKIFKFFTEVFFYWMISLVVLTLCFRGVRQAINPPSIDSNKIVGHTQYFGYPFYFDSIIFHLFLFLPILMLMVVVIRVKLTNAYKNKNEKNN